MPSVQIKFTRPSGLTKNQWELLAGKAREIVQDATPIDKGDLRDSWSEPSITLRSLSMQTDDSIAPYASYVNDGREQTTPYSQKQLANLNFNKKAEAMLDEYAEQLKG